LNAHPIDGSEIWGPDGVLPECGKQRVDHEALARISKTLDISADWLLSDTDPADTPAGFSEKTAPGFAETGRRAGFVTLPVLQSATGAKDGTTPAQFALASAWFDRRGLAPDALAVVPVAGDSLSPRLSNGDLVVIDTNDTELCDGVTYVFRLGTDIVIKRLQIIPQNHVKLCSHNPDFEPIVIDLSQGDLVSLGRVVASFHDW